MKSVIKNNFWLENFEFSHHLFLQLLQWSNLVFCIKLWHQSSDILRSPVSTKVWMNFPLCFDVKVILFEITYYRHCSISAVLISAILNLTRFKILPYFPPLLLRNLDLSGFHFPHLFCVPSWIGECLYCKKNLEINSNFNTSWLNEGKCEKLAVAFEWLTRQPSSII